MVASSLPRGGGVIPSHIRLVYLPPYFLNQINIVRSIKSEIIDTILGNNDGVTLLGGRQHRAPLSASNGVRPTIIVTACLMEVQNRAGGVDPHVSQYHLW